MLAKMRKPTLEMFKKYWQVASSISGREELMNDPVSTLYDRWGRNGSYDEAEINEGMRHRESLESHGFNRRIELGF